VIHGGPHAVLSPDFVDGVDLVTIKQDTFGKGGFSRIDMRTNPYIPHPGDVNAHVSCFSLRLKTAILVNKGSQLSEYSKIFNKLQGVWRGVKTKTEFLALFPFIFSEKRFTIEAVPEIRLLNIQGGCHGG
jgi:hypothetical protein